MHAWSLVLFCRPNGEQASWTSARFLQFPSFEFFLEWNHEAIRLQAHINEPLTLSILLNTGNMAPIAAALPTNFHYFNRATRLSHPAPKLCPTSRHIYASSISIYVRVQQKTKSNSIDVDQLRSSQWTWLYSCAIPTYPPSFIWVP